MDKETNTQRFDDFLYSWGNRRNAVGYCLATGVCGLLFLSEVFSDWSMWSFVFGLVPFGLLTYWCGRKLLYYKERWNDRLYRYTLPYTDAFRENFSVLQRYNGFRVENGKIHFVYLDDFVYHKLRF